MKKTILFILTAFIGVSLMSCEPIRDDFQMSGLMDPSEVASKLSATGKTQPGSNGVVLNADGLYGGWFYDGKPIGAGGAGQGVYTIVRSEGEHVFTFKQTSDAGYVDATVTYNVTTMDVELPPLEVTVWQDAPKDVSGQPQFTTATGADWSKIEAGCTLHLDIENNGVGWGQGYYADWSKMIISIPGGYADNFIEIPITQEDVDNITRTGGILCQGAGWSVTKIILIF
jgi:hypothetical protein